MSLLRRAQRLLTRRTIILLCIALFIIPWLFGSAPEATIREGHPLFANLNPAKNHSSIVADADAVCRAHGFKPWRKSGRKVYDLTMLSTELDFLEIRMHTLKPYVDYFVVVESNTTFTGLSKPLYLQDNWQRFKDFHHKMIHLVVTDPVTSDRLWDHEAFFRNSMLTAAVESGSKSPHDGDVLIVGDMDEIIRPETAMLLRYCAYPTRVTLRSKFFYYAYQWQHRGDWPHPQATVYHGRNTLKPEALRMNLLDDGWSLFAAWRRRRNRATLYNAGWHCSFCFSTIAEMQDKMAAFSHQGLNTPENRDPATIIHRVSHGLDLFGREDQQYDKIKWLTDLPEYVMEQFYDKIRLGYLIERTMSEYADFADGPEMIHGKGTSPKR